MKKLSFIFLAFSCWGLHAQQQLLPMNSWLEHYYLEKVLEPSTSFHSAIKPYYQADIDYRPDYDYPFFNRPYKLTLGTFEAKYLEKRPFQAEVFPLVNLGVGYDFTEFRDQLTFNGGVGAGVRTHLGKKVSAHLHYQFNYLTLPYHMDSLRNEIQLIPGVPVLRPFNQGYQYNYIQGAMSYAPDSIFRFQLGHGRHFIGDGYRSLMLSDAAAAYPYFKTEVNVWRIKYMVMYSWMRDILGVEGNIPDYRNKFSTVHYLSANITDKLSIGLFESVVWQQNDSLVNRGMDINYLNPVIFYRPIEYNHLGSADRMLVGLNVSYKLNKRHQLYGQLVLDEFLLGELFGGNKWWGNKYGVQVGYKSKNPGGIKGLYWQGEYNFVRPFTYSHVSSLQSYSHMNMPLAHPIGANFMEALAILRYSKKRLSFEAKSLIHVYGADTSSISMGGNVLVSYKDRNPPGGNINNYGHVTTQGLKNTVFILQSSVGYLLFPEINMRAELGAMLRVKENTVSTAVMPWVFFGLKTSLWNQYHDF